MNKPSPDLYIGTMSGTSMNGIDVCAISMSDRTPKLIAFASYNYPPKLSAELFELIKAPSMHLDTLANSTFKLVERLHQLLSVLKASMVSVQIK